MAENDDKYGLNSEANYEYRPHGVVVDGVELAAGVRVHLPTETMWHQDLMRWEHLIAVQLVLKSMQGPQALTWLRKSIRSDHPERDFGASRKELASRLGVTEAYILQAEKGAIPPTQAHVAFLEREIQRVFDVM